MNQETEKHRVDIYRCDEGRVREMRALRAFTGVVDIVDEGWPSIGVECSESTDAMMVRLAAGVSPASGRSCGCPVQHQLP